MKLLNNKITAVSLLLLTVTLYLIFSFAVGIPFDRMGHKIWKGYYTLVLDIDAPVMAIVSDLEEQGGWDVLSEYNSLIEVFDYNQNTSIPVSDLHDFYVEGDPLYDPFLQKLPLLFMAKSSSKEYHILYIKSDLNQNIFSGNIQTIMDSYSCDWLLPEIKSSHNIINLAIFAFAILILVLWHRELWAILIPGIFPWIQFVLGSGLPGVLVSIIFIFSCVLLGSQLYKPFKHYLNLGIFDPIDKKKLILSLILMILSFIYLLFIISKASYIFAFIIAVLAHASSVGAYIIIIDYKSRLQQHRMFFPVRIRFQPGHLIKSDLFIFTAFILIIAISPLIIHENKFSSDIKLPVAVAIEGVSDFSAVSMEILNTHSAHSELPNLSDYISHMMFLETYPYGFKYFFPVTHEKLTVPGFSKEGNSVIEKNVNIFMFTDSWYESIMVTGLSPVVELLHSQGIPTLVSYRSSTGVLITGKYIRNHYWFSISLVLVLGFWLSSISQSGLYLFKEILLRRKQEAV